MAGSRKWFVYTTDRGTDYAIQLDESNTEQINGGTQDFVDALTITDALPRNYKPRVLIYENAAKTVRRKLVALTQTIYAGITAGNSYTDPVSSQQLFLTRKVGEIVSLPFAIDTGLIDGDNT